MKQVLISKGTAHIEEVPSPQVEAGTILVSVANSCISIGTEMSGLKATGQSLLGRALQQPQNVKKALDLIADEGFFKARDIIANKMATEIPIGYSAAGIVIKVGEGVSEFKVGDRVACAGAQCAYHAEIIRVPKNLATPVPQSVALTHASSVALGAIALQGVRRANPTMGETFVVVGLGILGQIATQLLRTSGCRVIGLDLDFSRVELAEKLGMEFGLGAKDGNGLERVALLTDGFGADGVIITAATPDNSLISNAFKMCRKKGRVVLVGDVGLDLNRNDFYQKELDFYISTSYGPGRYDGRYEESGLDYPIGYVRWTENRNMAEYIRLLQTKQVDLERLINATFPITQAEDAYRYLKQGTDKPLMVLLSYPQRHEIKPQADRVFNSKSAPVTSGTIRIAVVGAGGFAKAVHLPNLIALKDRYSLNAVVCRNGHNAAAVAKQFGAKYSSTSFEAILEDRDIDALIIATRHNSHAEMALAALRAGKHVLLEKPLALNLSELKSIEKFYSDRDGSEVPVLLTGFNRRFSKYAALIQEVVQNRKNPLIINYRMNAGYIPLDHWVHSAEGGGRNLGEACHIYDLFTFITGARVRSVSARSISPNSGYYSSSDNFLVNIQFDDGSLASLTYTALGNKAFPKETMEIFVEGKVISLVDYKELQIAGSPNKSLKTNASDKGQLDELITFAETLKSGKQWASPLWQQIQATQIALQVEEQLRSLS